MTDTNEQSFSAAFAEFSGQPAAAPEEGPPAEVVEDTPAATEETQPAAAEPDEKAPPEGEAETVEIPDIWANAPDELRSAYEAEQTARKDAEHRLKSGQGREAAFQRNLHQLRRQLKAVTGSLAGQDDPAAFLETEEWKKVKADYGDDDLKPLFENMERMAQRQKALGETLGAVGTSLNADDAEDRFKVLDVDAPDWKTLFARDDFNPWLEKQPKMYRDSMAEQWKELTDPASVVEVANRYRRDLVLQGAIQIDQPNTEAAPAAQPTKTDPRRAVQLDGARTVSANTPPVGDAASEFSDFFQQAAAAKDRQLARH